jgi:hypothetical protein
LTKKGCDVTLLRALCKPSGCGHQHVQVSLGGISTIRMGLAVKIVNVSRRRKARHENRRSRVTVILRELHPTKT